ncbi:DUF2891 domain-containing protein [Akkermansiaceae bacterium]|nr:DUF2891 domain-containing protein [Akkermansiaceae bacterium]
MKLFLAIFTFLQVAVLHAEMRMTPKQAEEFIDLALKGLSQEYPNKISVMLRDQKDLKSPQEMFPVFYGHFDWHSSVHGHWTLVRLMRMFSDAEWQDRVHEALRGKFSAEKLQQEADYLEKNKSFERMYGWAWALRLGVELRALEDVEGKQWAQWYQPLEEIIVKNAKAYLPKLDWPIRCGFHAESSFALGQMLDWARATGDVDFEKLLIQKAKQFYLKDVAYPVRYEPSGNDFFSTGLNTADLMRRVLKEEEYQRWLTGFFPKGDLGNLEMPAQVSDLEDSHLVHLAGLNLNRAWDLRGISTALEGDIKKKFLATAEAHEKLGLTQIFSGSYMGEHWLGSFATYLLTGVGE